MTKEKKETKRASHHHGDLRQALLAAALNVSAQAGPQHIAFRDLARKLGVTTGAPYHHFADKSEMLLSLAEEGFYQLLGELRTADGLVSSAVKKIDPLTRAYLRFGREQRGYYRLMFDPEAIHAPARKKFGGPAMDCFDLVCGVVSLANKHLTAEQATERTVAIWSLLHGMVVLSSSGPLSKRLAPDREDSLAVETVARIVGHS